MQKLQIIEESCLPGETVSSIAGRQGVAPNLLYRWRRLLTEGGAAAVGSDEPVVASSEVRRSEERVRDLERLLGRKTMEVEILKEALSNHTGLTVSGCVSLLSRVCAKQIALVELPRLQ